MFCSAVVRPAALSMTDRTGTLHTLTPKAVEKTRDTLNCIMLISSRMNAEYCGWFNCLSLVKVFVLTNLQYLFLLQKRDDFGTEKT